MVSPVEISYQCWATHSTDSHRQNRIVGVKKEEHPVRLAVTDNPSGPSLRHLLEMMGKEEVIERIERAFGNAGLGG